MEVLFSFSQVFILNNIVLGFIRNDHNPRLAMVAMTASSLTNILLDYVFIIYFGLGMFGAALATLTSPALSLFILMSHGKKADKTLSLVKPTFNISDIHSIIGLGSSSFISEFSSGLVMLLFNFTILELAGNSGVAAYGVIANVAIVIIAIYIGIAQGIQPLLSENYGIGSIANLNKILLWGISTSLIISGFSYLSGCFFDNSIVSVFNKNGNPEMTEYAITGINIYFFAFFFMGINIIMASFFAAVALPKPAIIISMMRGGVLIIPLIILMPHYFAMTGVWLVVPVVEAVTFCFSVIFLVKYKDKLSYHLSSLDKKKGKGKYYL